jgi:hypothetical protein
MIKIIKYAIKPNRKKQNYTSKYQNHSLSPCLLVLQTAGAIPPFSFSNTVSTPRPPLLATSDGVPIGEH